MGQLQALASVFGHPVDPQTRMMNTVIGTIDQRYADEAATAAQMPGGVEQAAAEQQAAERREQRYKQYFTLQQAINEAMRASQTQNNGQ